MYESSNHAYIARPNRTTCQYNERILLEQRHGGHASILILASFNARMTNLLFPQSVCRSRNGGLSKDKRFAKCFITFSQSIHCKTSMKSSWRRSRLCLTESKICCKTM